MSRLGVWPAGDEGVGSEFVVCWSDDEPTTGGDPRMNERGPVSICNLQEDRQSCAVVYIFLVRLIKRRKIRQKESVLHSTRIRLVLFRQHFEDLNDRLGFHVEFEQFEKYLEDPFINADVRQTS